MATFAVPLGEPVFREEDCLVTRATYGGTESRFTDGSVVVFFKSSFCNWLRAHAIFSDPQSNFFCQPGVVALAGSLSCY